jgi:hypothetical protein
MQSRALKKSQSRRERRLPDCFFVLLGYCVQDPLPEGGGRRCQNEEFPCMFVCEHRLRETSEQKWCICQRKITSSPAKAPTFLTVHDLDRASQRFLGCLSKRIYDRTAFWLLCFVPRCVCIGTEMPYDTPGATPVYVDTIHSFMRHVCVCVCVFADSNVFWCQETSPENVARHARSYRILAHRHGRKQKGARRR